MKRMNSYWYEDLEKVYMDELEDSSNNTPAANINTVLEKLDGIADGVIIANLSRGVDIPVIRAIIPCLNYIHLIVNERVIASRKEKRVTK